MLSSLNTSRIHHMDLYRLSGNSNDLAPLNLEYVLKECKCWHHTITIFLFEEKLICLSKGISLIEWPSRLGSLLPNERLDITFRITDTNEERDGDEYDNARYLLLEAHGENWTKRLKSVDNEGYLDDMIVETDE